MRKILIGALVTAAALAPAARADFVIASSPPAPSGSGPSTATDQEQPATPVPQAEPDGAAAEPQARAPQFLIARGFGNQVPLSFAVKQIVPTAVKVRFGPGANRNALVDWKGGQPWNRVLMAAIKPIGLEIVMTTMAVEIRR